jgi:nitroreductase
MTNIRELVLHNRSYRRFNESHSVSQETLAGLVDLARCTASAANRQPLKYIISASKETNNKIFSCLAWAAYLKDWKGPDPGERPSAYIIILIDEKISKDWWCDDGIAAQTILLGAVEIGLAGCMLGSIQKEKLRSELDIPEHLMVRLVLALGEPAESIVLEDIGPEGDIRYWRDEKGIHHVPKRKLEDLIIKYF